MSRTIIVFFCAVNIVNTLYVCTKPRMITWLLDLFSIKLGICVPYLAAAGKAVIDSRLGMLLGKGAGYMITNNLTHSYLIDNQMEL